MGNNSSSSSNSSRNKSNNDSKCQYCCCILKRDSMRTSCPRCGTSTTASEMDNNNSNSSEVVIETPPHMGYNPLRVASDGELVGDFSGGDGMQALQYVHMLPFRESLESVVGGSSSDMEWLDRFVHPYFERNVSVSLNLGAHLQIEEVDWKIIGAHPITGRTAAQITEFRCCGKPLESRVLRKMHVVPTRASILAVPSPPQRVFEEHLRPYFRGKDRHVLQGECFVSNGLQFKVMRCEPVDGIVTSETQIYTDGPPVPDLQTIHILPIYETLPNRDKNITEDELRKKYVNAHFRGRFHFLSAGEEFSIDGTEFKVVSCNPSAGGIVTFETLILTHGEPLRYDDVKQQQLASDEELARRLQQEESGGLFPVDLTHIRHPARGSRRSHRGRPMVVQSNNRLVIRNVHEPLALLPLLLQGMVEQRAGSSGVDQVDLEALPTRTFQGLDPSMTDEERSDEVIKCMVCLSEYEVGDELRTLPCFHSYHKVCIDKWLGANKTCPVRRICVRL